MHIITTLLSDITKQYKYETRARMRAGKTGRVNNSPSICRDTPKGKFPVLEDITYIAVSL